MEKAIIFGIIQGIFEWLPVSSEGILVFLSRFMEIKANPLDFALFLHLGTLFSVLVYFRRDWGELLKGKDKEFVLFLIVTTTVSLLVGFFFYQLIIDLVFGRVLLVIMAFGFFLTSFFHRFQTKIKVNNLVLALVTGFFQGLAVIPGISRSGSTMFVLSWAENNPSKILKKSYLLSVPVVLASSLYLYWKKPLFFIDGWLALVISFLFGILSLKTIFFLSKKMNFAWFTFVFGLFCLLGAIFLF